MLAECEVCLEPNRVAGILLDDRLHDLGTAVMLPRVKQFLTSPQQLKRGVGSAVGLWLSRSGSTLRLGDRRGQHQHPCEGHRACYGDRNGYPRRQGSAAGHQSGPRPQEMNIVWVSHTSITLKRVPCVCVKMRRHPRRRRSVDPFLPAADVPRSTGHSVDIFSARPAGRAHICL